MPRELLLHHTAREGLATGRLPRLHSQCIWGGYGRGDICSLCGEPIRASEVEFELAERAAGTGTALRFHITCHAIWQLECAGQ
jgi:hypothetical protein